MYEDQMNERELAVQLFGEIQNSTFKHVLRYGCYKEIAPLAPPQAVEMVLSLPNIPPRWAGSLLLFASLPLARKNITALAAAAKS